MSIVFVIRPFPEFSAQRVSVLPSRLHLNQLQKGWRENYSANQEIRVSLKPKESCLCHGVTTAVHATPTTLSCLECTKGRTFRGSEISEPSSHLHLLGSLSCYNTSNKAMVKILMADWVKWELFCNFLTEKLSPS